MFTRISSTQIVNSSLSGVQDAFARFDVAQRQVNTGKKLQTPSDDPAGANQVMEMQERSSELTQYGRTITLAQGFLSTSESALSSVTSLAQQARTLGVQGANSTTDQSQNAALSSQIDNIIQQVAALGNTNDGTRYIFGGQRSNTAPLVKSGNSYQYVGGTATTGDADLTLTIGRNETMKINVTGDQVFTPLLTALGKLRDDVATGAANTVSNVDLSQVDSALNNVLTARADIGAKLNHLTTTTTNNSIAQSNYTKLISDVQDVDLPTAVVNMQTAQNAYQAALEATTRTFQNSLLDFIK